MVWGFGECGEMVWGMKGWAWGEEGGWLWWWNGDECGDGLLDVWAVMSCCCVNGSGSEAPPAPKCA